MGGGGGLNAEREGGPIRQMEDGWQGACLGGGGWWWWWEGDERMIERVNLFRLRPTLNIMK